MNLAFLLGIYSLFVTLLNCAFGSSLFILTSQATVL